jgi:hypothetical protein
MNQIKMFKYNFYYEDTLQILKPHNNELKKQSESLHKDPLITKKTQNDSIENKPHRKFKLTINSGRSYRLAKVPSEWPDIIENYANSLKKGFTINFNSTFFFHEQHGIGLNSSYFNSNNSINSFLYGKFSDNITIFFIGPFYSSFGKSDILKNLYGNMGFGYLGYLNKGYFEGDFLVKGKTIGIFWDFGYLNKITDYISLVLQISFYGGSLSKFVITKGGFTETFELEKQDYENLNRIDLTLGFRF